MQKQTAKLSLVLLLAARLLGCFSFPPKANAGLIVKLPSSLGLNTGLFGYWTFDQPDIYGNTAHDRSGSGNNGTINGASPIDGKLGQGLKFNGRSDDLDTSEFADNPPNFTVSVSFNSSAMSGTGFIPMVVKISAGSVGSRTGWGLFFRGWNQDVGQMQALIQTDENNWVSLQTNDKYNDGKWHHAVMSVDFVPSLPIP